MHALSQISGCSITKIILTLVELPNEVVIVFPNEVVIVFYVTFCAKVLLRYFSGRHY